MSKRKNPYIFILLLAAVLCIVSVVVVNNQSVEKSVVEQQTTAEMDKNVAYELVRLNNNQPEQVIEHIGYTVSYNPTWLVPNWVAYELTAAETGGEQERSNHFKPDPLVEGDPVVTSDYSKSGYDRGHMAPANDMRPAVAQPQCRRLERSGRVGSFLGTTIREYLYRLRTDCRSRLSYHRQKPHDRRSCGFLQGLLAPDEQRLDLDRLYYAESGRKPTSDDLYAAGG